MTERIFPTDKHGNPLGPAREEVVRCRDCMHYDETGNCLEMLVDVTPDGFCDWGARADA